ncbi:MAG: glycosyltransferase family 2 protein [Phycisphaerae bacterium]|nr:glycosyltransferase family 2 protein [Phycisphaerae bacterium]
MGRSNAKVAVIIPSFNRWPHLCDAIDSVMSQTYDNVEAVVVDDASTDGTSELLKEKYGDQLRLITLEVNGEKSAARNCGVRSTDAEYICMLDSDDILLEDAIADRMGVFRNDPSFDGVVYGLIMVQGRPKIVFKVPPQGDVFEVYAKRSGFLNNNAYLLSRDNMLCYGMYNETLTNMEDRELLLRLALHLPFRCCGTYTQNVRRINGNTTRFQYRTLFKQGKKYSEAVKSNQELVRRLGRMMTDLEFSEDKVISDALYKSRLYADYRRYSNRMFRQYGQSMLKPRYVRRYLLSLLRPGQVDHQPRIAEVESKNGKRSERVHDTRINN